MAIAYDPLRIRRSDIARACDYWLDGRYDQVKHERQELIDEANQEYVEEAISILEAFFPAEYHRRITETDIARMVVALILYRMEGWDVIDEYLNDLADEFHYFPDVS
jgi:hypothetical protein